MIANMVAKVDMVDMVDIVVTKCYFFIQLFYFIRKKKLKFFFCLNSFLKFLISCK
ncbi:hypothetical protein C1645_757624 [Glomus cerebriforme]|uniref:Uncharacterized protein n=1 Tax=Glomus cerebriforme TaxID=658196 RepID=A0A397TKT2_9GLOM|nr:hypothetical protein C1645_757624 [Glomus cerebriforme]